MAKNNKRYSFTSFGNINDVYNIIYSAWQGNPPLDYISDITSENQRFEPLLNEISGAIIFLPTEKIDNFSETLRVIFPISVDKFFDLFIADNAVFSIADHFTLKGK